MANLKKEHIVKGFDGNLWIQMKRLKTSKLISVPLLPKAKQVLDKYSNEGENALPKFSNQKINSYLKEIEAIVGINKSISHNITLHERLLHPLYCFITMFPRRLLVSCWEIEV